MASQARKLPSCSMGAYLFGALVLTCQLSYCFIVTENIVTNDNINSNKLNNSSSGSGDEGYQALDIINRSQMGILKLRGYSGQVHYAINKDGYYIHLVRIINPFVEDRSQLKRPVVFNHGLIESSTIWLINSRGVKPQIKKEGLCETLPIDLEMAKNVTDFINGPMLLANHGYDVWLMSMRGTDYSQYHQMIDTSMPEFWDYSLDNFALDDVPSVINYIRRQTGARKVGYIGHSQATFSVFGLLASRPRYAEVIEPVFAVAPVAYMHHTTSVARALFMLAQTTGETHASVPESAKKLRASLTEICTKTNAIGLKLACGLIDALVGGFGKGQRKGYFSHFPFYTSRKVLRHFGQIVSREKFTMYDHGPEENMKRYGVAEAPTYKIANIRSRSICLFWTKTDNLSAVPDVERFKSELTVPLYRDVFIDRKFNHFDLITHDDARYLVFAPMLQVLEEFEQKNGACQVAHGAFENSTGFEETNSIAQARLDIL